MLWEIRSGFRKLWIDSVASSSAFADLGFHTPRMVVGGHNGRPLVRGWFAREDLKAQLLFSAENVERVVEVAPDDKVRSWSGECIGAFEDLDVAGTERDGEVVV